MFEALKSESYTVASPTPHGQGVMSTRLYGWLALRLGAMDVAYEVNDRDPENRLSVPGLKGIGAIMAEQLGLWLFTEQGEKRHQQALERLEKRRQKKADYLAKIKAPLSPEAEEFDLLMRGF